MRSLCRKIPQIHMRKTGERSASLKEQCGFTTEYIASELGLSPDAIKKYLYGQRTPSLETFKAMCGLFGVSKIDDIVVWEEIRNEDQ